MGISRENLIKLRTTFPPGTRVKLLHMDDPYTKIPEGTLVQSGMSMTSALSMFLGTLTVALV